MNTYFNRVLIACCFITATIHCNAQRFAFQGGIESTSFIIDGDKRDSKIGFNIGGFLEIPLNRKEKLNLNTGLEFTIRGYSYKDYYQIKVLENYTYIEIPLTLSYRFGIIEDKLALLPYAGFYGGGLIGINNSYDNLPPEYGDNFQNIDLGLKAGISVEIVRNIQVAVEKNIGLLNLYKESQEKITNTGTRYCLRFFF